MYQEFDTSGSTAVTLAQRGWLFPTFTPRMRAGCRPLISSSPRATLLQPQHWGLGTERPAYWEFPSYFCLSTKLWNQNTHFFFFKEKIIFYVPMLLPRPYLHMHWYFHVHLFCVFTYVFFMFTFSLFLSITPCYSLLAFEYLGCLPFHCLLLLFIVSIFVHIAFLSFWILTLEFVPGIPPFCLNGSFHLVK